MTSSVKTNMVGGSMFELIKNVAAQLAVAAMIILLTPTAHGAVIIDPEGDFLSIYTGPENGDLDVLRAEVFFDGSIFNFTSTSAANVGTTPSGIFVWGINRGLGSETFPIIAPGVRFDAVVIIAPGGNSFVSDLNSMVMTPIPASDVSFSGPRLSARVPASTLPSLGFSQQNYTVNLWPRSELLFVDEVISDFAPDNSNAAVTTIPEPSTFALFITASAAIFLRLKRVR